MSYFKEKLMNVVSTLKSVASLFGPPMNPDDMTEPDDNLAKIAIPVFDVIRKYFRAQVDGLENVPEGKALLVGNHNAGITFLEPFFLGADWYKHTNGRDALRPLGHDAMVEMPLVGNLLIKLGAIRASHEAADKAFKAGHKVVVFPGGNFEAFRPYKDRYKVDFGGKKGWIKLALRHQVPIVPVLSIGGHETFFVLHRGEKIAEVTGVKKHLRSESFPIFVGLPWGIGLGPIFHLPLPSKCRVVVGRPIPLNGYKPEDANDSAKVQAIYDQVHGTLQAMMTEHAAKRRFPVLG